MSLLQSITDFLESIFKRSSPEVQKKQLVKKLDAEIREFQPVICKAGNLQGNFAEAIYTLYKNTKPLDNLFSVTISPNDMPRQHRFEAQLILTGYSEENQKILDELSYKNRKQSILENFSNSTRVYIHQKQQYEKILKELNTDKFRKIDKDILMLRQLVEFCRYNFIPFLQSFDTNFVPADLTYSPSYVEVPASKALNLLEDLYYQTCNLRISTVTGNMVLALAKLKNGTDLSPDEERSYLTNLKKINFVLNRIIPADRLKTIIRYVRQDLNYEPEVATYAGSPRQEFATMLQNKFNTDEQRIKSEIQDEKITEDVKTLFPNNRLDEVSAYNQRNNEMLQNESSMSFMWVLPLKILKTFLNTYVPESVKSLLNDLVIEGFFNNPTYKTSFSAMVYAIINANSDVAAFEEAFGSGKKNSIAVLESYVKDSKKDKDFYKRLEKMVFEINNEAHELLQTTVMNMFSLYRELGELLADAKKPSSEIISNLKVLLMSSRNRDNTNFLEEHYGKWKIFFEIMKNYVIINSGDITHE